MMVTGRSEPSGRPKLLMRVVFGGLSWVSALMRLRRSEYLHWTRQEQVRRGVVPIRKRDDSSF